MVPPPPVSPLPQTLLLWGPGASQLRQTIATCRGGAGPGDGSKHERASYPPPYICNRRRNSGLEVGLGGGGLRTAGLAL